MGTQGANHDSGRTAIGHVPPAHPGELLYGWLSRIFHQLGSPSPSAFSMALFGWPDVRATYDLPNHLDALAGRVLPMAKDGASDLADGMTLYPYYAAYLPEGPRAAALDAMRGRALAPVHGLLGVSSFRLRVSRLRFCPDCAQEMEEDCDEQYWRRDFQVPSAVVCPRHRSVLRASLVATAGTESRLRYIRASREICPADAAPVVALPDRSAIGRLVDLATMSARLLEEGRQPRELAEIRDRYRARVGSIGMARGPMFPYRKALRDGMRAHWGAALAAWPELPSMDGEGSWQSLMTQTASRRFHPLQHLLLSGFLDAEFLRKRAATHPFGEGPWRCENPLAGHRGEAVIGHCEITRLGGDRGLSGRFDCSCGYEYTRRHAPDGTMLPPYRRRWGPLATRFLRTCVRDGTTITEAARRMECEHSTVVNLAGYLGIAFGKPRGELKGRTVLGRRVPSPAGSEAVRGRSTRIRSPEVGGGRTPGDWRRRDWSARDAAISSGLDAARSAIVAKCPPERVTAKALASALGVSSSTLALNMHRLPLTNARWPSLVETTEQWCERRARWVCERMRSGEMEMRERYRLLALPGVREMLAGRAGPPAAD